MTTEMLSARLTECCIPHDAELPGKLLRYHEMLLDWNTRMDLTAVTDEAEMIDKHYVLYESFENIAVEMKYSYRHICNIHGRALQAFEKVLEEHRHMQEAIKDMRFVQITKAAGGNEK